MTTPISTLVYATREKYIALGAAPSPERLNNGYCVNIAEDIESLSQAMPETETAVMLTTDDLIHDTAENEGWTGSGHDAYNIEKCLKVGSPPPFNLSGEQLGKIITGYHAWVYAGGKHYDAECPEGTGNLFDLPIHKRAILASAMSKNV